MRLTIEEIDIILIGYNYSIILLHITSVSQVVLISQVLISHILLYLW